MDFTNVNYSITRKDGRELTPFMTREQLEHLFNEVVDNEKKILFSKNDEYSNSEQALSNFYEIAKIQETTPYVALWNLMSKHLYSVHKLVTSSGAGASRELIREKIGDTRNYLILLEALLLEKEVK